MKNQMRRLLSLSLAGVTAASLLLAGCGGSSDDNAADNTQQEQQSSDADADANAADDADAADTDAADTGSSRKAEIGNPDGSTDYTWVIGTGELSNFYDDYNGNPIYQDWWSKQTYDAYGTGAKSFSVTFTQPPAGGESDYMNTLLATQDYPDVMDTSRVSETVGQLYDEEIALDLTELVEEFMPNYMAWMEEHPDFAWQLYNNVDGEKKILQIYTLADWPEDSWCSFVYRRDWIVKYGKNPETGKAFTGSWDADRTVWTDDVVFPSGGTDPIYISDWEWMLEIMMDAIEGEGIEDGYGMQLPSGGYWGTGEFVSGFGGGSGYYLDKDGKCQYGYTTDNFRAYLECMSTWAANGWINNDFEENIGELFWKVDQTAVFSGEVGIWYGRTNQLGCFLDPNDGDESNHLNGAVIFGAAQPINDIYGDASCRNVEPQQRFANSYISQSGTIITNKAKDKDLGTLLTAMDDLFSEENRLYAAHGFSDVQQAEIQNELYNEYGLQDGAYSMVDGKAVLNKKVMSEDGLESATNMLRVPYLAYNKNMDRGYTDAEERAVEQWMRYENTGYIQGAITKQLTPDQSEAQALVNSNVTAYMDQIVPLFVHGDRDVTDDADWQDFVDGLEALNVYDYCEYIDAITGN